MHTLQARYCIIQQLKFHTRFNLQDPKERLKLVRQRSYSNPVVPTIRQPAQDIDDDRQISHDSSSPSKSPVAPHHHIVPELTIAPSEPDIPSVNEEESPATGQQQYPSFLSLHEVPF